MENKEKEKHIKHLNRVLDNRKELLDFVKGSLVHRFDNILKQITKTKDNNIKKKLISRLGELKADVFYFWIIDNWRNKDFDKIAKDKFCIKHILK